MNNELEPPSSDRNLEIGILGGMITSRTVLEKARTALGEEDFYFEDHRFVFATIKDLDDMYGDVDPAMLFSVLDGKLPDEVGIIVGDMVKEAIGPATCGAPFEMLRELSIRRNLRQLAGKIQESLAKGGSSEEIAALWNEQERLLSADRGDESFIDGRQAAELLGTLYEEAKAREGRYAGIETGFEGLNRFLNGLCPEQMTVIGARPSIGKTTLALQIALHVARNGTGVGFFSIEMSKAQMIQKLAGMEAMLPLSRIWQGELTAEEEIRFNDAREEIGRWPIFIDDNSGLTAAQAAEKMTAIQRRADVGLWVFDYLQLMESPSDDENERLNSISTALKKMSRKFGAHLLALSQLNRLVEHRRGGRPQLADLRGSGGIEQDADNVLLIYRPGFYEDSSSEVTDKAFLLGLKSRYGPTDEIPLLWLPDQVKFGESSSMR